MYSNKYKKDPIMNVGLDNLWGILFRTQNIWRRVFVVEKMFTIFPFE